MRHQTNYKYTYKLHLCLFLACNETKKKGAVKRLVVGKFGTCAGQACISVDYILVERKFLPTLVNKTTFYFSLIIFLLILLKHTF